MPFSKIKEIKEILFTKLNHVETLNKTLKKTFQNKFFLFQSHYLL